MAVKEKFRPNVPNWHPTDTDYVLVFMPVDGLWIEVGHDVPKFKNVLLADFLQYIGVYVPDWSQFLRVIDEDRKLFFEYRAYDCMRVTIRVCLGDK